MSTTKPAPHPLVILKLPRRVPALITYAQGIVTAMTGNAAFAGANPTLATITGATNDLLTAETAALSRAKGAVAIRKTWVEAPGTLQAKTVIAGLTPGATVQFRYRALTKAGEGDWSQVVQLIVK